MGATSFDSKSDALSVELRVRVKRIIPQAHISSISGIKFQFIEKGGDFLVYDFLS
jgi:hypothetical protein